MLVVIISILFSTCLYPVQGKDKVVKVGFPIQAGFTMKDEDGNYSGYTYDYLKEVAQYTDWNYEFVEVNGDLDAQLTTLLTMLENGEIDILGSMVYSDKMVEKYDYASENYGNAYNVLASPLETGKVDEYTLTTTKGIKIALNTNAQSRNESFFQYASMNAIDYEIVWCQSEYEQMQKVNEGNADLFLSVDLGIEEGYRNIAKFSPTPFYFATTKGNTTIIQELNRAINNIGEINPTLEDTLYTTYFTNGSENLFLTPLEKEYIKNKKALTVLVRDEYAPIQYVNSEDITSGIGSDVLENIQEKTGLEICYVYANDYQEYVSLIKENKIDMILAIQYEYDLAKDLEMTLSNPYLEGTEVIVTNKHTSEDNLENGILAVSEEYAGVIKGKIDDSKVRIYSSAKECLDAIESGICDYYYGDSFTVPYYQNKYNYKNINTMYQTNQKALKYSFGLVKEDTPYLAAIVNKSIRIIQKQDLEQYIYANAQQDVQFSLWRYIEENIAVSIIVIMIFVILIVTVLYTYYHGQMKLKKKVELEYRRYRSLSEVMKEIIFEYDYLHDKLKVSKEGMEAFGSQEVIENYFMIQHQNNSENMFYQCLLAKQDADKDVSLQLANGQVQWYHIVMKVIYDNEQPVYAIGRAKNIHQEKMEKELLVKESTIDHLTNVYNSATCKKKIHEILNSDTQGNHALCMIDVDYFKNVNDTYGHYVGDQVLIEVVNAMKETFHHDAIIGRVGGDEFLAFFPNVITKEQIEEKVRSLIKLIHEKRLENEIALPTVSIGIVLTNRKVKFIDLFKEVDAALYKAKENGRDTYYSVKK